MLRPFHGKRCTTPRGDSTRTSIEVQNPLNSTATCGKFFRPEDPFGSFPGNRYKNIWWKTFSLKSFTWKNIYNSYDWIEIYFSYVSEDSKQFWLFYYVDPIMYLSASLCHLTEKYSSLRILKLFEMNANPKKFPKIRSLQKQTKFFPFFKNFYIFWKVLRIFYNLF